ncbi:hypothetical protein ACFWFX_10005 [Streptomyces roseolus]|uniref:hypothetical protein n=1 Tax=Streptomyces roseolus TaxID=67358 RepID=UPI003653F221
MYHAKFQTQFGETVFVDENEYKIVAECYGCKERHEGQKPELHSKLVPWAQSHAAACRAVR